MERVDYERIGILANHWKILLSQNEVETIFTEIDESEEIKIFFNHHQSLKDSFILLKKSYSEFIDKFIKSTDDKNEENKIGERLLEFLKKLANFAKKNSKLPSNSIEKSKERSEISLNPDKSEDQMKKSKSPFFIGEFIPNITERISHCKFLQNQLEYDFIPNRPFVKEQNRFFKSIADDVQYSVIFADQVKDKSLLVYLEEVGKFCKRTIKSLEDLRISYIETEEVDSELFLINLQFLADSLGEVHKIQQ
ncbi:MAG: hypothetical protein AAF824_03110 [Bacteroidota bacterium]